MSGVEPLQTTREFDPNDPFFSVSVIVPFYNGHKFIECTLRSILSQTVRPVEVILIDDESPSPPLLSDDMTEQLTIIRRPNHGASASRNFGASIAKGRWLAFCDQDDVWLPSKLEKQLRLVGEVPELHYVLTDYTNMSDEVLDPRSHFSYTPENFWTKEQHENGFVVRQPITGKLSTFQPGITSTPLVLKDFYLENGGFDEQVEWGAEDTCFHFRCLSVTPFGVVPEVLMYYRRHPEAGSADDVLQLRRTVDIWTYIAERYSQAQPYRAELLAGLDVVRKDIRECERYERRQKLKRLLGIH
jgi:glycosyltransferase involved in cell wall biosynthesis